jgi:hypothetical protein
MHFDHLLPSVSQSEVLFPSVLLQITYVMSFSLTLFPPLLQSLSLTLCCTLIAQYRTVLYCR